MSKDVSVFFNPNLRLRTASASVLAPLVLGIVWVGGVLYALLISALVVVGLHEWLGLTGPRFSVKGRALFFVALTFLGLVAVWGSAGLAAALSLAAMASFSFWDGGAAAFVVRSSAERRLAALGLPYLFIGGLSLVLLRNDGAYGLASVVYLLAVVWGADIGGYLAGRLIGGPKLCPAISPKKTWAGFVGGVALAGLLGYAAARGFDLAPQGFGLVLAPVLAVIAQAGDLFESWVKRRAGAKDSGALIPGHGGLLDRVDGLLFAAMALAAFSFGD